MLNRDRTPIPGEDLPDFSYGQRDTVGESRVRLKELKWKDKGSELPCMGDDTKAFPAFLLTWSDWGKFGSVEGEKSGGPGACGGSRRFDVKIKLKGGGEGTIATVSSGSGIHDPEFEAEWEFRNGAVRDPRAPQPIAPPLPLPAPPGDPEGEPLRRREGDEEQNPTQPFAPELPPVPTAPPFTPTLPPDRAPLIPPGDLPGAGDTPNNPPGRGPSTPTPGGGLTRPATPVPLPQGPQLGDDGTFDPGRDPQTQPNPQQPVPPTPPDIIIIGDDTVGQPGNRPQPTMDGISRELGRLEQKAEALLRRPQPEEPDLSPLTQLLEELLAKLEELADRPPPEFPEFPEFPEIPPCPEFPEIPPAPDLGPIQAQLEAILAELEIIKNRPDPEFPEFPEIPPCPEFPEIPPPPDLGPIQEQLEEILAELETIKNRPDPEFPEIPDPVDLAPLEAKIQRLVDEVFREFDGDSYELQPPCDFDSSGDPKEADVATWQAGEGKFLQLARQIDALALLIQYHKDQRQPTCAKGGRQGEPVTVLFEQVI
mgnify:FL=1